MPGPLLQARSPARHAPRYACRGTLNVSKASLAVVVAFVAGLKRASEIHSPRSFVGVTRGYYRNAY